MRANLFARRRRGGLEQFGGREQHSRRTEAALQRGPLIECVRMLRRRDEAVERRGFAVPPLADSGECLAGEDCNDTPVR